jgi:osmotically-inducible protein OsmY
MAHLRYRDDHGPSRGALLLVAGALAGLAAGVLLAQRFGGLSAMGRRVRDRLRHVAEETEGYTSEYREYEQGDEYDDLDYELTPEEELEERVLETFRNDPVLSERAIDIGAIGTGIIELTGWVHGHDEVQHAVTVARGTTGVDTVVNRLTVREEEDELDEAARDYEEENPEGRMAGHWEGQQVGTGRRRQGTSGDPDRHADPKPELEDKWLGTDAAIREAADDIEGIAERREARVEKGDRTGGAPVAPTGVPKADHVADPENGRPAVPGRGDLPGRG